MTTQPEALRDAQAEAAHATLALRDLQSKLLGAANYIDVLGGDSKIYRVALAAEIQAQNADASYPPPTLTKE